MERALPVLRSRACRESWPSPGLLGCRGTLVCLLRGLSVSSAPTHRPLNSAKSIKQNVSNTSFVQNVLYRAIRFGNMLKCSELPDI